jgi:glycolate oxidase
MAATVGGSISTNAGGLRASMYGTTKEWVLGLEVVLPDGSSMTTGGRVLKRSAGYDLTALFVGAEGTLGVITKAFLKIWPKPEATGRILAYYDTIEKIGLAIRNIKASGITPLIAEFLDRITMDSLNKAKGMSFPEAASYMLILDVASTELSIAGDLERTANMLRELNPIEISITRDPDEMARIYEARKGAYSSLLKVRKSSNQRVIIGDVVVPASELPAALKEIAGRAEELGIMVALFGHISDGNIHANIFAEPGNAESMSKEEEFQKHLGRVALEHGGSVSAEHGIGIEKKDLLLDQEKFTSSEEAIDIMRKIKHAFDPNGIMNRGKIFD